MPLEIREDGLKYINIYKKLSQIYRIVIGLKTEKGEGALEKVILHCPMNISRAFSRLISEFIQKEYSGGGSEFEVYDEPHRLGSEDSLLASVREGCPPALYIGHATDFGRLSASEITASFEPIPDLPLAESLQKLGFKNEHSYFHPFTIIPFGVIYNKELAGEKRPESWQDFQDPIYYGRIRIPDRQRTISRVLVGTMKTLYPDTCEKFIANCVFHGSPIEVVNAVDQGKYHYGMVNIAFSRFSRFNNTAIMWIKEGSFCMPLVIAIGKGKSELVGRIVAYILSSKVQDFFALQGFIPAVSGEIPAVLQKDDLQLIWKGWDDFLKATAG